MSETTPVTLLERLRDRPTPVDWERFHAIYSPLLRQWLTRIPGLGDEADDIAQDVMAVVVQEIRRFERRRNGSFRAWLRGVAVNRVRAHWRGRGRRPATGTSEVLDQLSDPASALSAQWERDHDRHVFDRVLAIVRPDFEAQTWAAFTRFAVDGLPAAVVAVELGMSENAVVLAKARVLNRLREEAGELID